uniref:Uncharacterized protein n=1 Tax=Arion vulgaris TaxID=1028688 RepID=A0A0B7A9Y7_9EUPU
MSVTNFNIKSNDCKVEAKDEYIWTDIWQGPLRGQGVSGDNQCAMVTLNMATLHIC